MNTTFLSIPKSGELIVPMTNDYLFKVLLQENEHVLRGLLCSLLHMKEEEITSTEITNSIKLGESFTEKTFMLDVVINLNNARTINLEMQVINYDNWTERSLAYLGREFSKILKGANYADAVPAHQIGILNFTLFKDYPKFYSTYMMQELENHNIYSSKFALSVLDLTQIDNATDVDKSYRLDHWARLFSAKTWEDLNTLAKENPIMAEATNTINKLTEDELVREACFRRNEQLAHEAVIARKLEQLSDENSKLVDKNGKLVDEIDKLVDENDKLVDENDKLVDENGKLNDELCKLKKQLEEALAEKSNK